MGNESSRPETADGRSRSLSPLPRNDPLLDDEAGFLPPFPSTMPAMASTRRQGSDPPSSPGLEARHRRRQRADGRSSGSVRIRSRSSSPEKQQLNASQPVRSLGVAATPEDFTRPATQPELFAAKKARSSKGKKKNKRTQDPAPHNVSERAVAAGESTPRTRRSPAPSPFRSLERHRPLDDSESDAAVEVKSANHIRLGKKNKGKAKEVVGEEEPTSLAEPSIFDFDDDPPPSAQLPGKRVRRGSSSRKSKEIKTLLLTTLRPDVEGLKSGPSDGPLDQTVVGNLGGDDLPSADHVKAEREDETEPVPSTQPQPVSLPAQHSAASSRLPGAPATVSQRSHSDSGYAEPDGQAPPGSKLGAGVDIPDGLPRYQTDHRFAIEGEDSLSVRSSPPLPLPSEEPFHSNGEADASPNQNDFVFGSDDNVFGEDDEPGSGMDAPSPILPVRDGEDLHSDGGTRAIQHQTEPVSTAPQSSAKSTASRSNTKRKSKRPFFQSQEEENADAFAELPLDDVASAPRPRRSARPRVPAQGEAGPSTLLQRAKPKKPKKRTYPDSAAEDSDGPVPAEKSQYRSGPFSKSEQDQITKAVERFRRDEDLTQEEINRVIHENPQTNDQAVNRQLWSSIQDACPSRPRKKLIGWCRQRFHNFAGRGTWTQEQDDELADMIEKHGKKWTVIGGLINRYPMDARDRWRNYLVCRGNLKTDYWSEGEEDRFRDLVETTIEKIKDGMGANSRKSPDELVNWLDISEAMGHTRTRLACIEKWKRMRAAEPLADNVPTVLPPGSSWRLENARKELRAMTADDKYLLMRAVLDTRVGTDTKIKWSAITRNTFNGRYERQTIMVAWGRLRKSVPDWELKTTRDCARYLCEMYEREGNFGVAGSDDVQGAEDNLSGDASASTNDRQRKGKEVVRPQPADISASGSQYRTTDGLGSGLDTGLTPAADMGSSSALKKSSKRDKSHRKAGDDTAVEDQATTTKLHAFASRKRPRSAEKEASPELDTVPPPQSPSLDAQIARSKGRKRRASIAQEESVVGEREMEMPTATPDTTNFKVSKRPRRESLTNGRNLDSPRLKKHKTSKTSAASKSKVNSAKAGKAGEDRGSKSRVRSRSVVSSDMDDMEDIPASLPWPSQAAR